MTEKLNDFIEQLQENIISQELWEELTNNLCDMIVYTKKEMFWE